ncbi:hypothetical protein [Modicisalibacter radicis]|uniref:hypothetical protein n=1 Tax=Halomonas sp. EAR18 TaxID=2518972 RepID=UPI00109CAEB5|nr:hypothetical protein [Halomonas sp. EAR18]
MITFRHVTDSLGESLFFQVDGREAGLVAQDLDGSYYVYFADIADAPRGVAIERATDPCSKGAFVNGYASEDDALALVYRTYGDEPDEPDEPECWLCDGCGEVETYKADGAPITVGCPACVQRDRDHLIAKLTVDNIRLRYAFARTASRVPSASAPVVIHTPFPASTGAAFYSQALSRPLLDAQRNSTTPTRNTQ